MKNEYVAAFLEVVESAEAYRPAVAQAIKAIKSYGPELYDLMEELCFGMVDLKARNVKRYIDVHGFSREEAILMTLDQWQSVFSNMQKNQEKSKK